MKKIWSFIIIILRFIQIEAWKEKINLNRFLQQLNLNHLDLTISDSLLYETENILDEEFDTVIQIIQNQSKFFSGNQSCKTPTLNILSMDSLSQTSGNDCEATPGTYIKNPCVTYFAYSDNLPNNDIYETVKCKLVHQPYIFVFVERSEFEYELLEVQIPPRRMIVIATWKTTDNIKYTSKKLITT